MNQPTTGPQTVRSAAEISEAATYAKVTRRIIPFLFICYILAYLDRVNVGFAKLQMQKDLGMTDTVYGVGAGIFFIGYFFFEVPCNIMLQKIGARLWLGPIMMVWGVVSACTMFVRSAHQFYALRFLLGVVESGFFPGVILYLTFWYTRKHRARMIAAFMMAVPLSGVFGGAISGWILEHLSSVHGMRGWEWLYLVEGIPSIVAGLVTMLMLADKPATARWLRPDERELLIARLAEEEQAKEAAGHGFDTLKDAFGRLDVWPFCAVYFGLVMANYGIGFWLPQIIKDTLSKDPWQIGLLSTIPWCVSALAMLLFGYHSDRTGERRWHIAIAGAVGALAFGASALHGMPGWLGLAVLTVATAGVMSAVSTFWAMPTAILSGTAASAGIAWINSVGNLAGYVSPFLVGRIRDATHSMTLAMLMLSACCLGAALLVLICGRVHKQAPATDS